MTLSNRRIGAVAATAAVILVLIWYAALFRPQSAHLKSANAAYQKATSQIQQLKAQVASLETLERQIPADQARLAALTANLPKTTDLHDALNQMNGLAGAAGVQVTSVNPTKNITSSGTGGVQSVDVNMTVAGAYPNMMSFLTGLDSMTRTVVVDSAAFSAQPDGTLTTSLGTRIFYAP